MLFVWFLLLGCVLGGLAADRELAARLGHELVERDVRLRVRTDEPVERVVRRVEPVAREQPRVAQDLPDRRQRPDLVRDAVLEDRLCWVRFGVVWVVLGVLFLFCLFGVVS